MIKNEEKKKTPKIIGKAPTDGEVIIRVENLSKVFTLGNERVVALKSINLEIRKGAICCIIGTSGSGKSTLLNMMAGLDKPTSGNVHMVGKIVNKLSEKQLALFRQDHIGFVFQSYNLISSLTAMQNVTLPLIFKGVPLARRNALGKKYMRLVGIGDRAGHRPNQMSGGQQQRVGIARAFVGSPKIVFADEPTGNLDTNTSIEIMDIIWKMACEKEQTIVIVTHDEEIADYADQIVHIRDGLIQSIEYRTKEEVYEKIIKPHEAERAARTAAKAAEKKAAQKKAAKDETPDNAAPHREGGGKVVEPAEAKQTSAVE